ncbi:hypothetical protein EC988_000807 [Linderina pennispora]|nr:hypothetical protein EC988_000807 [Linderina pennispora]
MLVISIYTIVGEGHMRAVWDRIAAALLASVLKAGKHLGTKVLETIDLAHVLDAEAVAFSYSPTKKQQATELVASIFVDTSKQELDAMHGTLSYLFITANAKSNQYNGYVPWIEYEEQIIASVITKLIVSTTGSFIGSKNIKEALEFVAKHRIRPIIERYPMAKVNEAIEHMD